MILRGHRSEIKYQSLAKMSTVQVVHKYEQTNAQGKEFVWLRHLAFRPRFKRFDGQWYLEVTPTYVFTWDGHRLYRFHEESLSKIKQIERNRAVLSGLLVWADYLGSESSDLFGNSILEFGPPHTVELPVGIDDDGWSDKGPEEQEAEDADGAEKHDLFSLLDKEGLR